jgi:hypothetical protein
MEPRWASAGLPFLELVASVNAPHVAEELRFQQGLGNGGAVDLHERQLSLRAAMVHGASHQLLSRAGLAGDQHRAAGCRDQLDAADDVGDGTAPADDAVPVRLLAAAARSEHCGGIPSHKLHSLSPDWSPTLPDSLCRRSSPGHTN